METFSALLAICAGNSPVPGEFPTQRPVTRSFDVFFDLRLNKRLSKHSGGWWFEMPSRPLWRHCNVSILGLCIKIVPLSMQCVPRWMEYMWNLALRTGPTIMILAAAPRISCATKVSFTTLCTATVASLSFKTLPMYTQNSLVKLGCVLYGVSSKYDIHKNVKVVRLTDLVVTGDV